MQTACPYREAMKIIVLFFAVTCFLPLWSEPVKVPAEVYAPKSPVNGKTGTISLSFPEGWKHTEHNGIHYIIGGSDVYLSVSLAYDRNQIMRFSSQFGTPTPPKSEIEGVTVYHQIKNGAGSYLRKMGTSGWSIRASLQSYPAFKGKDLSAYHQQVITMLATAEVDTPPTSD